MSEAHSQDYPLLDLSFIQHEVAHLPVGHTIVYRTSVPSTMPIAAELAQDPNTPSGIVVVAEEQTAGRGRGGRSWHTPYASALLVSVILKPPHIPPPATLTMLAGVALLKAVAAVVPEITSALYLKWPNDLVIGSDPATARKAAGILAESSLSAERDKGYAILGIGTNVNQHSSDLPRIAPPTPRPISLRIARSNAGHPDTSIDRSYLLVHLCRHLSEMLAQSPAEIYQQWRSHLATLGQTVAVYDRAGYTQGVVQTPTLIGQAVDVQEDGGLVVLEANGERHTVYAADVSIRAA
jgi:BirA family biotin operon repressor/biotin-[acetyl-CoA-carboxylase] ligase